MLGRWTVASAALTAAMSLAADCAWADPDFNNRQDFDFAQRGFVGTRADPKITAADGRLVWDLTAYDFLTGPAPSTANPSLWRQAQLLSKAGLFKVTEGVWQVRGFDISNATFIQTKTGWFPWNVIPTFRSRFHRSTRRRHSSGPNASIRDAFSRWSSKARVSGSCQTIGPSFSLRASGPDAKKLAKAKSTSRRSSRSSRLTIIRAGPSSNGSAL